MAGTSVPAGRPIRRYLLGLIFVAIAALAILVASQIGTLFPGGAAAATASPGPGASPAPSQVVVDPSSAPTAAPPTPEPTPELVPAPLTGVLVSPKVAAQHPVAVMIDDHYDARPQSGFNAASVVWQAPAEGGIPRYMLIFQDQIPTDVGPVRSARQYYVEWAAEWNSMYVHAGGSPQAIATLNAKGHGEWVYNADSFRWGTESSSCGSDNACYLWRSTENFAPHNVYTDGKHLRRLEKRLGAADGAITPAWRFGADKALELRPDGGRIQINYPYETIVYRYDRASNTYLRFTCHYTCESSELKKPQTDRADGEAVAPKNVVILRMAFGPLNDGSHKDRLEAHNIGQGEAYISTGGVTVKGEWRKKSATGPTRLYGPDGRQITLTAGQTFVQVISTAYSYRIKDGRVPAAAASISPVTLGLPGL